MYPWYSKVQRTACWSDNHIAEGKKEINFSEFANNRIGRQYKNRKKLLNK
ncbi:MAG: heme-binding domain-containing protein [Ferruginibacter sp.]|nr:heme-binding domain-containing protein [Ferruginibacter sp.]